MVSDNLEQRVGNLEGWKTSVAVSLGMQEVDKGYINRRFNSIEEELKELKKTAKNLNYTIYAALIGYFIKFIVEGGLVNHSIIP